MAIHLSAALLSPSPLPLPLHSHSPSPAAHTVATPAHRISSGAAKNRAEAKDSLEIKQI